VEATSVKFVTVAGEDDVLIFSTHALEMNTTIRDKVGHFE
jgi:hypothetical protein